MANTCGSRHNRRLLRCRLRPAAVRRGGRRRPVLLLELAEQFVFASAVPAQVVHHQVQLVRRVRLVHSQQPLHVCRVRHPARPRPCGWARRRKREGRQHVGPCLAPRLRRRRRRHRLREDRPPPQQLRGAGARLRRARARLEQGGLAAVDCVLDAANRVLVARQPQLRDVAAAGRTRRARCAEVRLPEVVACLQGEGLVPHDALVAHVPARLAAHDFALSALDQSRRPALEAHVGCDEPAVVRLPLAVRRAARDLVVLRLPAVGAEAAPVAVEAQEDRFVAAVLLARQAVRPYGRRGRPRPRRLRTLRHHQRVQRRHNSNRAAEYPLQSRVLAS
eukprot:Rhum_TRINITY_DN3255_c0_g1::Rhum_TRINITY_DN3255_c0_g1_i1::g.9938::m.9938